MDEGKVDIKFSPSLDDKLTTIDEVSKSSSSTDNSSELSKAKNDAYSTESSISIPSIDTTTTASKETSSLSSEESSVKTTATTETTESADTVASGEDGGVVVVAIETNAESSDVNDIVHCEETETEKIEEISTQVNAINTPAIGVPLARSSPISREFLALQKSLNESKILTEFVADTSAIKAARKARKSGLGLSSPANREVSLNRFANRVDPLEISNEERNLAKRSNMRSHNSEFAQKHKDFLNQVIQQQQSGDEQYASELDEMERYATVGIEDEDDQNASVSNSSVTSSDVPNYDIASLEARSKSYWQPPPKRGWDSFCWKCCECGGRTMVPCSNCLRSFHKGCVKISSATKLDNSWNCPECLAVENALSSPKNSRRPEISMDMLSELLSFALKRMRSSKGNSKFIFADGDFTHFSKYIVNPVTFATLEDKIAKKVFRCSEEFFIESKWMMHNIQIMTGSQNSKLMGTSKAIIKACRQETNEIETCASCYLGANTRNEWFVDVCAHPHLLLWAKLKGFPYWPAKAMSMGPNSVVNVRFFGKHDRAFVSIKDCFLYSEKDPNSSTGKRSARELADCIKEVELHIKKIEAKVGQFVYAPFKTPYDPAEEIQQLERMMPGVAQYVKRQQALMLKPPLQYKIVKTADNHLSIIKKPNSVDDSCEEIQSTGLELNESSSVARNSGENTNSKQHSTSKYEVITKTTSNDSHSPKVSTVILKKRKSYSISETARNSIESGEGGGGGVEELVTPLAKVAKIDEITPNIKIINKSLHIIETKVTDEATNATTSGKRKQHVAELTSLNDSTDSSGEKHKAKHPRSEPRLPKITIKTSNVKIIEPTAREVAEHLAKSNSGVTIKKIPLKAAVEIVAENAENVASPNGRGTRSTAKELSTSKVATVTPTPIVNATATVSPLTIQKEKRASITPAVIKNQATTTNVVTITTKAAPIPTTATTPPPKTTKQNTKTSTEKEKTYDEHERNIFRELVPFVEIKQEVQSDDETETATTATATGTVTVTGADAGKMHSDDQTNSQSSTTETIATTQENQIEPLLTKIKEEAFSDDEANNSPTVENLKKDANNTTIGQTAAAVVGNAGAVNVGDTTVRVVGDTTIQRLSQRNAAVAAAAIATQHQQTITSINTTTSPPTPIQHTSGNANQTKRSSTRNSGVPFGPMPAAATSSSTSTSMLSLGANSKIAANNANNLTSSQQHQQQQQQQLNQRARKSFPNRSPPLSGATVTSSFPIAPPINPLISNSNSPPPPSTQTNLSDIKRGGMLKSTMVSIPVDVAAQRNITQNSIPMPPLTAVTKTAPPNSTATNSIATTNTANTFTNSVSTIVGTINPAQFATTLNNNNNNNNNNNSNSNNNNNNINKNSAVFTPIAPSFMPPTQNSTSKLSVPPPLAGLSFPNPNATTSPVQLQLQPPIQLTQQPILPIATSISTTMSNNNNNSSIVNNTIITTTCNNSNNNINNINTNLTPIPMDTSNINSTSNHLLGDLVTPALANAITEAICRGPPKMARRPNGPLQSDGSTMFPSEAGPVCRTLVQNAHKLTDFFISVMEDTMCEMSNGDEPSLQAKITLLTIELERIKQAHEQEIAELKRTSDLMLCEMRKSMENEKTRIANEIRKQCELERLRSVEEAKRKQWCANCGREAQFYCCWNTSYCDYPCQQQHWSRHAASCAQTRSNDSSVSMSGPVGPNNTQPTMTMASNMNAHTINNDGRNKSSTSVISNSTTINVHYNKNVGNSRKDKHNSTSSGNNMVTMANKNNLNTSIMSNNTVTATVDGLKLPSNTFLRPVTANSGSNNNNNNNNNSRSTGYNPNGPGPRYNISLPISTTVNPTHPYTFVQRGNSFELMNSTNNTISTLNPGNNVPGVQVSSNSLSTSLPNVHTQQRAPTMPSNMVTAKGGGRNRGVSNMTYNTTNNGSMRSTQM